MRPLLFNLVIALISLFISAQASVATFFAGFTLGFILIASLRKIIGEEDYVRRVLAFARFVPWFLKEFLASNFGIASAVLFRPRGELSPHFVVYDTSGCSDLEVFLLALLISMVPGQVCVAISRDKTRMLIHAFHCEDEGTIRSQLDLGLRKRLVEFTR